MLTLGIETSCDDTSCGIVDDKLQVLANCSFNQEDVHRKYGGVVPEVAARAHLQKLHIVVEAALEKASASISDIGLIAFTRGPGLIGPLLVGASFAKGLAHRLKIPITGINHLEGHLAAAILSEPTLKPPYLCLTVSGGHTELCIVHEGFKYEVVGKTRDDAAGEAFDKCGKLLNLGYPAGPILSRKASTGNRKFHHFPRGLDDKNIPDFSFSGLKTSFLRYLEQKSETEILENLEHICASLETAIVDILVKKTMTMYFNRRPLNGIVVCGGVSANRHLRDEMQAECAKKNIPCIFPRFDLCTDNGAMIAGQAQLRYLSDAVGSNCNVEPNLRWEKF